MMRTHVHDEGLGEAVFSMVPTKLGRRRHPRYRVELDVHLGSDHNFYAGFVENLSAGGIFVATHQPHAVGDQLEIAIRLPNREEPITGIGEVRWLRESGPDGDQLPGVGIRFLVLDGGGAEAIEAFTASREPMFYDDEP